MGVRFADEGLTVGGPFLGGLGRCVVGVVCFVILFIVVWVKNTR